MGFDATVFCDCFERGELSAPSKPLWQVSVHEHGYRYAGSDRLEQLLAFDQGDRSACEHEVGVLATCHIGSIARVDALRESLAGRRERYALILGRALYNGSTLATICPWCRRLSQQLNCTNLPEVTLADPEDQHRLRYFEGQMRELVAAALRVEKPIVI